jgi:hypothetical protein
MLKKILFGLVCVVILWVVLSRYVWHRMGGDVDTIFKPGGCMRFDEMGVTYRIDGGPIKGGIGARVIVSDKYPSSDLYKVGSSIRLPLYENPNKLYPIKCP